MAYSENSMGTDTFTLVPLPHLLADLSDVVDGVYTDPGMTLTGLDFTIVATVYVDSVDSGSSLLRIDGDEGAILVDISYAGGSSADLEINVRWVKCHGEKSCNDCSVPTASDCTRLSVCFGWSATAMTKAQTLPALVDRVRIGETRATWTPRAGSCLRLLRAMQGRK